MQEPSVIVQKKFSQAAPHYDFFTEFHRQIGQQLMHQHHDPLGKAEKILDLGMGTGWMTHLLKKRYPQASVYGLDFAAGMVARAKKNNIGCPIIQGNAQALPFQSQVFDVIISNLTCQWVEDWLLFLHSMSYCLKAEGTFCFSMFGYHTFQEIFETIQQCGFRSKKENDQGLRRLLKPEQLQDIFQTAGWPPLEVSVETHKIPFDDLVTILRWIKNVGANGLGHPTFIGKNQLKYANNYYQRKYKWLDKDVYTTFELIRGVVRHKRNDAL